MVHQETEGLLSPLIRDIRLRRVASYVKGGSIVLDIACGNGRLAKFLPENCQYFGIDRVAVPDISGFAGFMALDLFGNNAFEQVQKWLPQKPDYITCVAFLEHVDDPKGFIREFHKLLSLNGKFIGTTPHPRGKSVHESLSTLCLCSRHAAEEHKDFLGKKEIEEISSATHGNLSAYSQFLLGLNQLFIIEYPKQ